MKKINESILKKAFWFLHIKGYIQREVEGAILRYIFNNGVSIEYTMDKSFIVSYQSKS